MKALLVVDDAPDMRALIGMVVAGDRRLVVTAEVASAEAAVAAARSGQPDLVILDNLLEGDVLGVTAAPLVKQVAPGAKVLLFSDYDMAGRAASQPAIDAYVPKRRLRELLPAVRRLLDLPEPEPSGRSPS